jgi:hypothetical protein
VFTRAAYGHDVACAEPSPSGDDEPLDGDALAPWVWAFLGEFPAAGIALGPTLAAWQRLAAEQRASDGERAAS